MSGTASASKVTSLLQKSKEDPVALANVIELVDRHLRRIAANHLKNERPGYTLQATELVHEAYMRIFGRGQQISWQDRGQFFGIAARRMRQILLERGRAKGAWKRGRGAIKVTLSHAEHVCEPDCDIESLEDALRELVENDPEAANVVELKFFAGLEDHEVAESLGISFAKVRRNWTFAKAFLKHRMGN